uniref:Putative adenylate/guanylate cyclase n=1 Tax=Magnetococcus massalia (strain MO-1) TaxID=451514 RepID=A0A1S7LK00_MAGMO|nr:Putative adenylate/guanylate cyclase [Candidatus Magnetococcus massalia]
MNEATLPELPVGFRLKLHGLSAIAVIFLTFYGKLVCPFIDKITFLSLFLTLSLVFIFQFVLKELLYRLFPTPIRKVTLPRHGFHLAIFTWFAAGVASCLFSFLIFGSDFYWSSYLKLLSGYWALGAGMLAQLEYIFLEQHLRQNRYTSGESEQITGRLMEGFAIFSLVPALVMSLMSFRFVYEGYIDKGAAFEVLFLAVCFVMVALFVSWSYGQALRKDCDQLTSAVSEIAQGRFQVQVDSSRGDELGMVAHGINEMGQGLALRERIREAFGRFVNPEVAESFIKSYAREENTAVHMGGERREVTILIADLRNFTPLSESLEPEDLTELLNRYMSAMVGDIQANHGMVDKFIGDAVLAVFGLTGDAEQGPGQAVRAGLAMRESLQRFNQEQRKLAGPELENGIGIHCGAVVAGYIGSPDRLEFTVIGHNVNVAARIEALTKAPQPPLLFSQPIADAVADELVVKEVVTTPLKGVSEAMTLYTLEHPLISRS